MPRIANVARIIVLGALLTSCTLTSPTIKLPGEPSAASGSIATAISPLAPAYSVTPPPVTAAQLAAARAKIKHIVIIMQENRSFDHYFGTFPGADGIQMRDGVPTVCAVEPGNRACIKPYHDPSMINYGGPHTHGAFEMDVNNGQMNGFIKAYLQDHHNPCAINDPTQPDCVYGSNGLDVMGWHDAREIPNYWTYAEKFVLQDHLFEPNSS